jgi:uncharacterized protein
MQLENLWISLQWQTARSTMAAKGLSEYVLVIDEIQKIENWSESVKLLWDEDTKNKLNLKVILLGSSRILIQQGLTESLMGRFEKTYISHWNYNEMHTAFGWSEEQYAWFGAYPGTASLIKNENRWKNYVSGSLIETSISKDILMLTRVDKPALMKKLFEFGCLYSGRFLSYTKMLGQLQDAGNTTTLAHYLHLLDTAGLLCGLEKFSTNQLRTRGTSPKFQVQNMALMTAYMSQTFKQVQLDLPTWGRVVESTVGAHLYNNSFSENYEVLYWREGNYEMDFIIKKGDKIVAIEVKSGFAKMPSGAAVFQKYCPEAKLFLISNNAFSWKEFIKINPAELF